MANVLVDETALQDIADAIREQNGTQNTYKPSQMGDAVRAIESGGITPTGTVNINSNGIHDVTQYASANVNVPTGITPTGTKQIVIAQNGTITEDVTNYASAEIEVNVPTGGGTDYLVALLNNTLVSYSSNDVTSIRQGGFAQSTNLEELWLPNVTSVGTDCFTNAKIRVLVFPKLVKFNSYSFRNMPLLEAIDFLGNNTNGQQWFVNDSALKTVIIRKNDGIINLAQLNSFQGTPFASGGTGGTLFVPSALIASYQANANWATILGYENNSIAAIEGSQYENYYANGTPIT